MNNRQGGEALINFVASRFKKGGPVAAFQVGGDVNDYESEAYGVGSSVSSTAASEDIGTVDEDRGPGDPPGGLSDPYDEPGIDPLAPTEPAPTEPAPEEPSDSGDSIVSSLTTEQLEKAVDAIEKAKYPSAVEQDMLANARAELSARNAITSGLLEDEKTVTQAAVEAIQPIDFLSGALADASTPMTSGAFVGPSGRGVMADISPTTAPTGSLMGASGAATDILGGYDRAMAEQRALANRDRMAAEMAASRGAINYTREELDSQQAADGSMAMGIAAAAPPSTVQGPGGPSTAEDVGAVPGLTATIEEMAKQLEVEDLSKFSPPREATPSGGVASLGGALMDAGKGIGQALSGKAALSDLMKGGTPIKSEKDPTKFAGTVTYTTDPVTGKQVVEKVSPTSLEMAFDPALRDAYRDFYANQPEQRDSDGGEPILPEDVETEEEEEAPKKPPTVDIIPFRPQDFAYFTPGNFAYNRGLPSMMNMRKG